MARFRAATLTGIGHVLLAARPDGPVCQHPAVFAAAVARCQALAGLREFRSRLHDCLALWANALFGRWYSCAWSQSSHAVTARCAGKIDDERFFVLLTETLPQGVDGLEAREWITDYDVIDHALLDKALAGVPAASAVQVRERCARWARLRFAVDAFANPRPGADCSPG